MLSTASAAIAVYQHSLDLVKGGGDARAVKLVVHEVAAPLIYHQARRPQDGQMLGDRRLGYPEPMPQRSHTQCPAFALLRQQTRQAQASRVRQGFQYSSQLLLCIHIYHHVSLS